MTSRSKQANVTTSTRNDTCLAQWAFPFTLSRKYVLCDGAGLPPAVGAEDLTPFFVVDIAGTHSISHRKLLLELAACRQVAVVLAMRHLLSPGFAGVRWGSLGLAEVRWVSLRFAEVR